LGLETGSVDSQKGERMEDCEKKKGEEEVLKKKKRTSSIPKGTSKGA